jgi:o-succinylbenzoate---CoA ligase
MAKLTCPIRDRALSNGEQIAVYDGDTTISYRQLDQMINRAMQQIQSQGLGVDDTLACCDKNSLVLIVILFACLRLGVRFCPLSFRLTNSEKELLLKNAGIRFCWQATEAALEGVRVIRFTEISRKRVIPLNQLQEIFLHRQRPATVIFTSGSGGQPKAAVHTLDNHFYSALGSQSVIPLEDSDCWLASLPFYHIGGLAIIMRCLFAGASLALVRQNDLAQSIARYPVTHASLVPTQLYRLLQEKNVQERLSSLRYLLLGGAPIEQTLLVQAKRLNRNIYRSYGLTEMCSQVATCRAALENFAQTLPYCQWRLIDGEIAVRGETLFSGYLVAGAIHQATQNGWFLTGDIGQVSSAGIRIVGRRDNQFVCGGENYQPEAVEKIILAFPPVVNAVIVARADEEFGAVPVAFIKWQSAPQVDALVEFLHQRLSRIKIPRLYRDWPSQVETSLKIDRRKLQQLAMQSR